MNWIIMPYRGQPEMTRQAVEDCLSQTVDTKVLLIDNGTKLGDLFQGEKRVLQWYYWPPLSLSAVWNTALAYVWSTGEPRALVVNNDVRLHQQTYDGLLRVQEQTGAWFVSGVGVTDEQFATLRQDLLVWPAGTSIQKGGPDFSCFLITQECHRRYKFDDRFAPAYCEDLDYHRRLLLDGLGDKIFGVNLPFLHYASGTLKGLSADDRAHLEASIGAGSRAYYREKWGGDPNQEIYTRPFDPTSRAQGVTTPALQRSAQRGQPT